MSKLQEARQKRLREYREKIERRSKRKIRNYEEKERRLEVRVNRLIRKIKPEKEYDSNLAFQLLKNVTVDEEKGCWFLVPEWLWYTRITINSQSYLAHRLSYELFRGPLNNLLCCHHCDRPGCINPVHLFKGTHKDNFRDAIKKDRVPRRISKEDRERDNEKKLVRRAGDTRNAPWYSK